MQLGIGSKRYLFKSISISYFFCLVYMYLKVLLGNLNSDIGDGNGNSYQYMYDTVLPAEPF